MRTIILALSLFLPISAFAAVSPIPDDPDDNNLQELVDRCEWYVLPDGTLNPSPTVSLKRTKNCIAVNHEDRIDALESNSGASSELQDFIERWERYENFYTPARVVASDGTILGDNFESECIYSLAGGEPRLTCTASDSNLIEDASLNLYANADDLSVSRMWPSAHQAGLRFTGSNCTGTPATNTSGAHDRYHFSLWDGQLTVATFQAVSGNNYQDFRSVLNWEGCENYPTVRRENSRAITSISYEYFPLPLVLESP